MNAGRVEKTFQNDKHKFTFTFITGTAYGVSKTHKTTVSGGGGGGAVVNGYGGGTMAPIKTTHTTITDLWLKCADGQETRYSYAGPIDVLDGHQVTVITNDSDKPVGFVNHNMNKWWLNKGNNLFRFESSYKSRLFSFTTQIGIWLAWTIFILSFQKLDLTTGDKIIAILGYWFWAGIAYLIVSGALSAAFHASATTAEWRKEIIAFASNCAKAPAEDITSSHG